MKIENLSKKSIKNLKIIIKKCHHCGFIIESFTESSKCPCCAKSFMPSSYFNKVHTKDNEHLNSLFSKSQDLDEKDLVKGLYVLW